MAKSSKKNRVISNLEDFNQAEYDKAFDSQLQVGKKHPVR